MSTALVSARGPLALFHCLLPFHPPLQGSSLCSRKMQSIMTTLQFPSCRPPPHPSLCHLFTSHFLSLPFLPRSSGDLNLARAGRGPLGNLRSFSPEVIGRDNYPCILIEGKIGRFEIK